MCGYPQVVSQIHVLAAAGLKNQDSQGGTGLSLRVFCPGGVGKWLMKWDIAGIYILKFFFFVNMFDLYTRGGESPWRA